jgi:hypothetical protein
MAEKTNLRLKHYFFDTGAADAAPIIFITFVFAIQFTHSTYRQALYQCAAHPYRRFPIANPER